MPYDRTKNGLIYQRPGNCDKARTHEEVAAEQNKDSEGVKTGLVSQKPINPVDEFGYPIGVL